MHPVAILIIIFMYFQLARYLFTGAIPGDGRGHYVRRSERPRAYWLWFISYAVVITFMTFLLCRQAK